MQKPNVGRRHASPLRQPNKRLCVLSCVQRLKEKLLKTPGGGASGGGDGRVCVYKETARLVFSRPDLDLYILTSPQQKRKVR